VADGVTHYYYWRKGVKTLPLITLGVWLTTIPIYWGPIIEHVLLTLEMACVLYLFGAVNDPDLDQAGISSAEGRMAKIPILGYFMILYWTAYALLVSAIAKTTKASKGALGAHRVWFTHSFLGTLIRIVWANIPLILFCKGLHIEIPKEIMIEYILANVIAFTYSDAIHYYHDGMLIFPTWRKR
jgi:hypothetical protein